MLINQMYNQNTTEMLWKIRVRIKPIKSKLNLKFNKM